MGNEQTSCNRCGKCCQEGGPALHERDLILVKNGKISVDNLITIRKGELVINPAKGGLQPASTELLKIKGKGKKWICHYYNDVEKGCGIYEMRPQACDVLKCWDTDAILNLMEKDVLTRFDIVDTDSDLYAAMLEHEEKCPCPDMLILSKQGKNIGPEAQKKLEDLVRDDLQFRTKQVKAHALQLDDELFYFGRPIFQLLHPFGVRILETPMGIELIWK
ncbi:MAG: YkgJ family cysteine cluster protein [Desulfotalea sp.]